MGCRLSVSRDRSRPKPRPSRRCHGPEELHFLDEFGRPITVQLEDRGRGQYGPMGAHWDLAQTPCYSDPYMTPDLYPLVSHDLFSTNGCVPSVSYSLDRLDHLDHLDRDRLDHLDHLDRDRLDRLDHLDRDRLDQDWLQNQFSCPWPPPDLSPDPGLGLDRVQPAPGLVPDFTCSSPQLHRGTLLSEAETDIVSSLPGHTPSSRGSSPSDSVTSSPTSEPSDSGFHSVSTAGPAPRAAGPAPGPAHYRSHHQRGRWELQSIPENWSPAPCHTHHQPEQTGFWELQSVPESGARARCSVGNSTTTTVHFHRAERSPTSPRQRSPRLPRQRSPSTTPLGCRTEPCQRRALWLQDGSRTLTEPNRSRTFTDLSHNQNQNCRRASHPCAVQTSSETRTAQTSESRTTQSGTTRSSQTGPSETKSSQTGTETRRNQSRSGWDRDLTHDRETGLNQDQNQDLHRIPRSPSAQSSQNLRSRSRESLDQVYTKPNRIRDLNPDHNQDQNLHSPLVRTSQTLRTRSNRDSAAQFYGTVQSSPRPTNQRPARRHRAPRLVRQRSDVTTDEEPPQDRRRPGHKNRSRPIQSRTGPDQDPLMVLRDQNLDRIRTRQILDEWTTVEELLSHGTRAENRAKGWPSPLLSVTTV